MSKSNPLIRWDQSPGVCPRVHIHLDATGRDIDGYAKLGVSTDVYPPNWYERRHKVSWEDKVNQAIQRLTPAAERAMVAYRKAKATMANVAGEGRRR